MLEIHRESGERILAKGYDSVPLDHFVRPFSDSCRLKGAYVWYKIKDSRCWLEVIYTVDSARELFVVCFFYDPGPMKIALRPGLYSTDATAAARFSWCLQCRKSGGILDTSDALPTYRYDLIWIYFELIFDLSDF